jgi:hypothetical protein
MGRVNTTYKYGTECSETYACKIQKRENHPKERIQRTEHDENLKSRTFPLHTPKQIKIKTHKTMIFDHPLFYLDIKPDKTP